MLEAAMERTKKIESSQLASSKTTQVVPCRPDGHVPPYRHGSFTEFNAPPLPARSPPGITSSVSSLNQNPEIRPSVTNTSPGRGASSTNINLPSGKTPARKNLPQEFTPPASRLANTSTPSTSGTNNPASRMPVHTITPPPGASPEVTSIFPPDVTPSSDAARITPSSITTLHQGISRQVMPPFPPDLTNSNMSPASSRLPLGSSASKDASSSSSQRGETNRNASQGSTGRNTQGVSQLEPHAALSTQSPRSVGRSVPPPLPSRPPPVRSQLKYPVVENKPSPQPPVKVASLPNVKNDAPLKQHSVQGLSHYVDKLQFTNGASSSVTNLTENPLQNSVSESSRPSPTTVLPVREIVVKLPEKLNPKRRSIAFGVPKIIKELDAAVLRQVTPKRRDKSSSFAEIEHSLEARRNSSPPEDSTMAEGTANNTADDYLDPKDLTAEGPRFMLDRPTLPRRLKHSRSLPLLNLVDSLRRDSSKNKVFADEQSLSAKLCLQQQQVISEASENGSVFPSANDEVFVQPWYHAVTWIQAQVKLTTMAQDGAFLVRPSSSVSEGVTFTLSVFFRGRVINCHISSTPGRKYVLGKLKPNQKTFDTVTELIRYYQSIPAELKISEAEPVAKVCLLITPPKDSDKIYAD